jgi:hypothetical protein
MKPKPVHTPVTHCLACKCELDAATFAGPGDHTPEPGDVTVCFYCGHLMAFADGLTMRELTDAEMRQVAGDRTILAIQRARANFKP